MSSTFIYEIFAWLRQLSDMQRYAVVGFGVWLMWRVVSAPFRRPAAGPTPLPTLSPEHARIGVHLSTLAAELAAAGFAAPRAMVRAPKNQETSQ